MLFSFTEDQLMIRDAVADLLKNECTAAVVRTAWENESGRTDGVWQKLVEQGVVGLTIPEAHGGLDMTDLDLVLLLESAGKSALPEPFADTTAVFAPTLAESDNSDLQAEWLPKVAGGDVVAGIALGEALVCGAEQAGVFLLGKNEELYLVTRDQIQLTPQVSVDRSRRLACVEWATENAAKVGGKELYERAYNRAVVASAAQLIGLSEAMMEMTIDYAQTRKQFGVAIGTFQALKHHCASALVKIAFARPMVYRAAYSLTHHDPNVAVHCSMAKHYAAEASHFMSKIALQCHGAIGYTTEYDLHLWMKRAWALEKAFGDAAWHRNRVAETIL